MLIWVALLVFAPVDSMSTYNIWGLRSEGYFIEIEIGTPPQKFKVLLDTGSANLAIAAAPLSNIEAYFHANESNSFLNHNKQVAVTYTQGTWQGILGNDVVRVPNTQAEGVRCDVALIEESEDFFSNHSRWQGILGLGYPILAQPHGSTSWLGALPSSSVISIELGCCANDSSRVQGFLEVLESPNSSPFSAKVIREWFYEVIITDAWIGDEKIDLPCQEFNNNKSILDSGTTNVRLPEKVFKRVVLMMNDTLKGLNISKDFWFSYGVHCFYDLKEKDLFPRFSFGLAQENDQYFKVILTPESYLHQDADQEHHCYRFALEPSKSGTVLGLAFLEGLKVTFDQQNHRVIFQNSSCGPQTLLQGPFLSDNDPLDCLFKNINVSMLAAVSLTLGGFLGVSTLIIAYLVCSRFCDGYFWTSKTSWPLRYRSQRELLKQTSDLDITTAT